MPGRTAASAKAALSRRDSRSPCVSVNSSKPSQALRKYSSVYSSGGRERWSVMSRHYKATFLIRRGLSAPADHPCEKRHNVRVKMGAGLFVQVVQDARFGPG